MQKIFDEILQGINLGKTIVFCGAGISKDSGLPIVSQLVPYILEKLKVPREDTKLILDKKNYPKIPFEVFLQGLKANTNIDKILDIYNQGVPNTNHILLAKLIKARKLDTIITTNFDKLIEKALSLEPKPLGEGIDYDVIYTEQGFEEIKWFDKRIRIIKIHGSIDDKESMAVTLEQVASRVLSKARSTIIEEVFSKGKHNNVLILGYSSSDVFDLSPQIQNISKKLKNVYYVQHSDITKIEDIQEKTDKNPFQNFIYGQRLYYNTGLFIKYLWLKCFGKNELYEQKKSETNWGENVDEWYRQSIIGQSKVIRYFIPAYFYNQIGIHNSAIHYYEQALKIARDLDNKASEYVCLGNLGYAHLNLGDSNKTIKYSEQALDMAKEIGDKKGEGAWLGNLGNIFLKLGKHNKAIECFEKALKIAIEIGDKQSEELRLGDLGNSYSILERYSEALKYFEQAIEIARDIGDKQNEGIWFSDLGKIYANLRKYSMALKNLEQALNIAKEIGDKQSEGTSLGSIGNLYLNYGDYSQALRYYRLALDIAIEIGDKQSEGIRIGNIGNAYFKLGEYNKAIDNYKQALDIFVPMFGYNHPSTRIFENNLQMAKSKVS